MRLSIRVSAILVMVICSVQLLQAQRTSRTSIRKPTYHAPSTQKARTYDLGGTKYKLGESYKSTGLPKVERSESAKRQFLKSQGLKKAPTSYDVDHMVPLSKGGADKPSNMQLLPKETHKQKTAAERRRR